MNRSSGKVGKAQGLARFDHAAPGDLQHHPDGHFAVGNLHHGLGVIADHADFLVRQKRVGAGRITDGINIRADDVRRRIVGTQVCTVPRGAWMMASGWLGSSSLMISRARTSGFDFMFAPFRLIRAFPDAQAGMIFELVHDLAQHGFAFSVLGR